jgi:translation initiation factor 2 subunit 2
VAREGTKKTVFTNFMELSKAMNRNQEHVQAYILAELGTSGECREGRYKGLGI